MADSNTSGDWSTWVQNVAAGVINKASDAKWVQPYTTEQMRLQALGQAGLGYYVEGQRQGGTVATVGINANTLMLVGGAVLLVVLLKRGK